MPDVVDGIEYPQVREVFCLVRCVLEASKKDNILLPVSHPVSASRWRALILALDLDFGPFPCGGLQPPKVRVVMESTLLWR